MVEVWKAIAGYEQHYEISNQGRVRSKDRFIITIDGKSYFKNGLILKLIKNRDGYYNVNFCVNNIRTKFYIHRLVAQAFIENPENKQQVNHLKCKTCNCVEELEWATSLENLQHAFSNDLTYKIGNCKTHWKGVINTETGECWPSIKDAAKAIGRNYTVVREMLNGRRKNTLGLEYHDIL